MNNNSKRIAKNSLMLYIRMLLVMMITLYTSRIVLNVLGTSDFGTYNVVGGFVVILAFFNSSISNATQRFLSVELGRNDIEAAKRIFSQSLLLYGLLCIAVLLIAFTIGYWFVNFKLNIPDNRQYAANVVYICSVLSSICTIIQVPYVATIISRECMGFYAYLGIFDVFTRLLMVFLLQITSNIDKLVCYAILMLGVYLAITIIYIVYCKCNFKECTIEWKWDKSIIQKLVQFTSYNLCGCFSYSVGLQGVNLVLNLFFGPIVNAARGIATQVNAAVLRFTDAIMTAVKPQIIKSYANGEYRYMFILVEYCSKLGCLCMMLLGLPIVFNAEFILEIWLKNVPDYTIIFVKILIFQSLFLVLTNPLWMLANATGQIKNMQLWGRLLSLSALPLSYFVLYFKLSSSPISAALILLITDISYWLFCLFDIKSQFSIRIGEYLKKIVWPLFIILTLTCCILHVLVTNICIGAFTKLVTTTISSSFVLSFLFFYIGMANNEREFIINKIKSYIK